MAVNLINSNDIEITKNNDDISLSIKTSKIEDLIDMIYPIGSVYISVSSTNPATLFGGTWSQINEGYYLMSAGENYLADQYLQQGLPNITGQFYSRTWNDTNLIDAGNSSGAFTTTLHGGTKWAQQVTGSSSTDRNTDLTSFDASSSNAIYGASNRVQPATYIVYIWKRTA